MEDELDDRVIYQTYISHLKIMSRVIWSIPLKLPHLGHTTSLWKIMKYYMLKPEILIFGFLIFLFFSYIQVLDLWSRNLLGKFQYSVSRQRSKPSRTIFELPTAVESQSWEKKIGYAAAYAIQGRRPKMEDRFVISDNINNTGISLFAVFDGHGGEFAANYAKEKLMQNLHNKIINIKDIITGKAKVETASSCLNTEDKIQPTLSPKCSMRKNSFRRSLTTDECAETGVKDITDSQLINKLNAMKPITRDTKVTKKTDHKQDTPITSYFDKSGTINYGKLITDEVLAADEGILEAARKAMDIAGTTALIVILENNKLTVANVGDSRGVMCDSKGNAIPLSFDHKPQQVREKKRIKEAGGFVTFNGVWRVAGILATSRALGDYPLKDKKLVIAEPDVLNFNLDDHKPQFIILASDGLWDTFSNEEAVHFIRERLHESDYGVKSITLQSYYRGSLDNITVIVINFKSQSFSYHTSDK